MSPRRRVARRGGARRRAGGRLNPNSAGFWKNVGNMIKKAGTSLVNAVKADPMKYVNKAVNAGKAVVGAYNAAKGTGGMYKRRRRRGGRKSSGAFASYANRA